MHYEDNVYTAISYETNSKLQIIINVSGNFKTYLTLVITNYKLITQYHYHSMKLLILNYV